MKFGNSTRNPKEKDGYFSYVETDTSSKPKCFVLGKRAGEIYIVNLNREQSKAAVGGDSSVSHIETLPDASHLSSTTCEASKDARKRTMAALKRRIPSDVKRLAELGLSVEDAVEMVRNAPERH
jgi:hypothetical protein